MKASRMMLVAGSVMALPWGVTRAQGWSPQPGRDEMRGAMRGEMPGRDGFGGPGRGMPGPGRGEMHRGPSRGMMMRDPIERLLDHQTLLRLTPAQVNNIIGIDDKLHADNKPLVQRLLAMRPHGRAGEGPRGGGASGDDSAPGSPDMSARRDSMMAAMRAIRQNVWRATAAANAVLTSEQLATAGTLDPAGRRDRETPPAGRR